jgi:NADPH-dependent F420 reductase
MATKKTIAIIGASGNMGSGIARNLARGNYRLLLFANQKEKIQKLADEIRKADPSADVDCMGCPFDASWEADIIIPAVPYHTEKEVADLIREVSTQKIVISISNPLNETFNGLTTNPDTSAAEELQSLLPHSRIVKAFNTVFAGDFAQPLIDGKKTDSFIAGNDEDAVDTVSKLVEDAGFQPVHAGKLSVSRTLENMTVLLIQLNQRYNYSGVAGFKILHNKN